MAMSAVSLSLLCALCVFATLASWGSVRRINRRERTRRRLDWASDNAHTLHTEPLGLVRYVRDARVTKLFDVVVAVLGVLAFTRSGVTLALVVFGVGIGARVMMRTIVKRREAMRFDRGVPHVLDHLARSARSGANATHAIDDTLRSCHGDSGVMRVLEDLARVARRTDAGLPFEEALCTWASERPGVVVQTSVMALLVARETGGSLAMACETAARSARQECVLREQARVFAAQARASAVALSLLPVVVTGTMLAMHPAVRGFMLHTALGAICLGVGLGLNVTGLWWMHRMIEGVTS